MIDLTMWKAKRTLKRIEGMEKNISQFKNYVSRAKQWKKEELTRLNLLLNSMGDADLLLFANDTGYGWEKKKK